MTDKKLTEILTPLYNIGKGLFQYLGATYSDFASLFTINTDRDFILQHSGEKIISPLCEKLLDNMGVLTEANMNVIAIMLYNHYENKWKKLKATLSLTYNPIENYDRTEQETNKFKSTNTNKNKVNAFNSSSAVDVSSSENITEGATNDNERNVSVHGNIGVTSSQQMIEQEQNLWRWDFLQEIFDDVARFIALHIY